MATAKKIDWYCGDCGTGYPNSVTGCTNLEMDKLALKKWKEGYSQGAHETLAASNALLNAIKTVSEFGLAVTWLGGE